MSEYKIFETDRFLYDLEEVGSNLRKKIYNKIIIYTYPQVRTNPHYGKNIRKLVNYKPPTWRYRIGDYRLYYEIDENDKIVYIIAIEIRSNAY